MADSSSPFGHEMYDSSLTSILDTKILDDGTGCEAAMVSSAFPLESD